MHDRTLQRRDTPFRWNHGPIERFLHRQPSLPGPQSGAMRRRERREHHPVALGLRGAHQHRLSRDPAGGEQQGSSVTFMAVVVLYVAIRVAGPAAGKFL